MAGILDDDDLLKIAQAPIQTGVLSDEDLQGMAPGAAGQTIAPGSGVGLLTRLGMSFASGPEEEANVVRRFGGDPVDLGGGTLGVKTDKGLQRVDPSDAEFADVLDVAGLGLPAAGGLLGMLGGGLVGSAALGAAGAAGGESTRQLLGRSLFGTQDTGRQGPDVGRVATEGALGAAGELGGAAIQKGFNFAAAPLKSALTQRAGRSVARGQQLDQTLGTRLADNLLPSARTESRAVGGLERAVAEAPATADAFQAKIADPFIAQTDEALRRIRKGGGLEEVTQRTDLGANIGEAASATLDARTKQVNELYQQLGRQLPADSVAEPLEAIAAIERIREKTGLRSLADFDVTDDLAKKLAQIESDVGKIRTFDQLDGFRKFVGSMLNPKGAQEEIRRVGLDAHLADLYGSLLKDGEGVALRANFGNQIVGDQVEALASTARGTAKAAFDLDRSSAARLLRDPDQLENFTSSLIGKPVAVIQRAKQKLGAIAGEGGLKATPEGEKVWGEVATDLMEVIQQGAIDDATGNLSGPLLQRQLNKLGKTEAQARLAAEEFFGKDTTAQLFDLGQFLREADTAGRLGLKGSRTAPLEEAFSLIGSPVRALGRLGASRLGGQGILTEGGQRFLTEGVAQGPRAQNLMGLLGRVPTQTLPRVGAEAARSRRRPQSTTGLPTPQR
ncbi:MAG: hypothetical protein HQ582_20530 [Planctomycetes bacterium]|nr:hypothetical protein [Planctomycetota bacterium]